MATKPAARRMIKQLVDLFGTTTNPRRTAFVLRDGRQITYHGTSAVGHGQMARRVGAKDVTDLTCQTGAIKLHAWANDNTIEGCYRPTKRQLDVMARFVNPRNTTYVDVHTPDLEYAHTCIFLAHADDYRRRIVTCFRKGGVWGSG